MRNTAKLAGAAFAMVLASGSAGAAKAATIVDAFKFAGTASNAIVASGSFSYDSSLSGLLSYGDLQSFSVTLGGSTYGLGFVSGLSGGAYVNFGYDTTTNSFVPASIPGSYGPYSGIIAGVDASLNTGFFFDPLVGQSDPAGTGADGIFGNYVNGKLTENTAASYSVTAVPELSTWAMMLAGFASLSFAGYRRTKNDRAVLAA